MFYIKEELKGKLWSFSLESSIENSAYPDPQKDRSEFTT